MFSLGQYVHELLLTNQQVGVPGIGIFGKRRQAARFDESSNRFLPPSDVYTLIIHAVTDRLLIDHVSKVHHLSAEEASHTVDAVVEQLLAKIAEQGEITLGKLGYLKEEQGSYQLIPFDQQNTWGLQPVAEWGTIDIHREEPTTATPVTITEAEQETAFDYAEDLTSSAQLSEDIADTAKATNSRWWIWMLAVLVVLVAGFYAWDQQKKPSAVVNTPTLSPDTTIQTKADTTTLNPTGQTTVSNTDNHTDTLTEDTALVRRMAPHAPYCIVIGSFKKLNLAIKQAQYFRSIGIQAYVLESNMPNNRKKICIGTYTTKANAMKYLPEVREKITAEAYIYP